MIWEINKIKTIDRMIDLCYNSGHNEEEIINNVLLLKEARAILEKFSQPIYSSVGDATGHGTYSLLFIQQRVSDILAKVHFTYRPNKAKKKLRNNKCDCGSGIKFKKCCMRIL